MRIPKRVNAVLDWMEEHFVALAVVVALVAVALVATLAPPAVGFPAAGFILGAAVPPAPRRRFVRMHRRATRPGRSGARTRTTGAPPCCSGRASDSC